MVKGRERQDGSGFAAEANGEIGNEGHVKKVAINVLEQRNYPTRPEVGVRGGIKGGIDNPGENSRALRSK